MMDDCQLIPDLVEPFDELEELDKRMDGLAAQSKTGELSTADVAEAVGRLLDGLPLLQAAQKTRGWAVMVKAVQDARDEAKAETVHGYRRRHEGYHYGPRPAGRPDQPR